MGAHAAGCINRRRFLAGTAAAALGLSGCLSGAPAWRTGPAGRARDPRKGVVIGAGLAASVWEINQLLTKLTVGEVMTRTVITIGPEADARDAAVLMLDHSIGALPVTERGQLVGIITETDIMRAFVWLTGGPAAPHPAPRRRS